MAGHGIVDLDQICIWLMIGSWSVGQLALKLGYEIIELHCFVRIFIICSL